FILFAFAFITTLSACKKFLDKKQNTSLVTPQTVADLQALLDDADRTMNTGVSPSFGEASSDDLFVPENTLNTLLGWTQYAYRWQPYAYRFPNDWSQAYIPIYNTNYCLEMLLKNERSAANTSEWDNVYGSALFYRAYYFLQLNWIYAKAYDEATASSDPGIVLRLTSDFNVPSERASVENCYKKIIEDVMEASYRLPAYARHVFRPSKAAAYGLLARTYLSMRKYDSAYKYADLCLGIKNELMNYNGDEEIGTITANNPFKRFNKETIFYAEMGTDGLFSLIAPARSRADTVFYESYEDTDLRKKAFFLLASGYYRFKGSYSQSTIPFTGIATDEIYLIRAECSARKGGEGIDQAISDMNKLLSHRYTISGFVPLNYTNPALLLDRILEERRKELFFRGIRWSDIKRLNKEGRNIILRRKVGNDIYELKPNANYYALPLPADIIEQAGIKQNEP
ncbi:MAG TPA: RagB/SusD family nutrient uptake outer membrane protein, partial [Niabella sp.]|nr:RagB/SusD family nutrient uptake outer membrane protein [Niabella sp.]